MLAHTGTVAPDSPLINFIETILVSKLQRHNEKEKHKMNDRITMDPAICHGKSCIRGMRYPVETVLEWLAGGMSSDEILADYEDLEREDILAVLAYAARVIHIKRMDRLVA